jgi:peptidoglycan glycosyltransferase
LPGAIVRLVSAVVCAALVLAGCTSDDDPPPLPSVQAAVDSFVDAWNDRDYDAMAAMFAPSATWTAQRAGRVVDGLLEDGDVQSFTVARAGEVAQPSPGATATAAPLEEEVDYTIEYSSEAAHRPVELAGTMTLLFDDDDRAWQVRWERALLIPGIDGARGFDVSYRWPQRGALLDRSRRPLARRAVPEGRSYPYGAVAGSTVGNIAPLSKEAAAESETGAAGDLIGGSGLERAYDEILAGTPSARLVAVDRRGEALEVLGRAPGKRGRSVRTTLDVDVQRAAENAFGSTVGGAVVMEPATGDVLAVVSSSPFDPNNYVGTAISPFNRALSGLYPPGSVMKVVTASAALDTGTVTPSTSVTGPKEYRGVRNFAKEEYGTISFATALQHSVNTAFAQVALKLGARSLFDYAEAFGFNREAEMPLSTARPSFPRPESDGELMFAAIGQGRVLATPLQMASVAATVANGGRRMEPRISFEEEKSGTRVVKKKTARDMTDMMVAVVRGGTGTRANIAGVTVAGKTGTAEVDVGGKRKNHAWFICFAPAEDPKVAVAVVSELGGVGGEVAAPLAARILLGVLPLVQ